MSNLLNPNATEFVPAEAVQSPVNQAGLPSLTPTAKISKKKRNKQKNTPSGKEDEKEVSQSRSEECKDVKDAQEVVKKSSKKKKNKQKNTPSGKEDEKEVSQSKSKDVKDAQEVVKKGSEKKKNKQKNTPSGKEDEKEVSQPKSEGCNENPKDDQEEMGEEVGEHPNIIRQEIKEQVSKPVPAKCYTGLSQRKRKEMATKHFKKLHSQCKSYLAISDLERLAIVKKEREEAAKRRDKEKKEKEIIQAAKAERAQKLLNKNS